MKAVVDVFDGQPRKTNKFTLERSKQLIKKAKEVAAGIQTLDFEQELMEDIGYRNSSIKISLILFIFQFWGIAIYKFRPHIS